MFPEGFYLRDEGNEGLKDHGSFVGFWFGLFVFFSALKIKCFVFLKSSRSGGDLR